MKGVILSQYNKNIIRAMLGLKVEERTLSKPGDNEVLIKIHAAPVNPSDIAFMQGGYNIVKTLPAVIGFEGAGTVEETGKNLKHLAGKKVSCFVQEDRDGTWAEYVITTVDNLLVIDDEMELDQAACFTVNPFTAYGLMNIALMRESKAVMQNAASGQVGLFIRKMAHEKGLAVINIVRKEETARMLRDEGEQYVFCETDDHFNEALCETARQLQATTAFDAVGGNLAGIMFNAMPSDSELVVYGGLSNKPAGGFDTMDLIFNDKIVSGFNLPEWKKELEQSEFETVSRMLQQKFMAGEYQTKIQGKTPLQDVVKGLRQYIGAMSRGKILLVP